MILDADPFRTDIILCGALKTCMMLNASVSSATFLTVNHWVQLLFNINLQHRNWEKFSGVSKFNGTKQKTLIVSKCCVTYRSSLYKALQKH